MDTVNVQMRKLGIGHLIEEGHVRRTITAALHDAGLQEPYVLSGLGHPRTTVETPDRSWCRIRATRWLHPMMLQ